MKRWLLALTWILIFHVDTSAQRFHWGPKGGLSIGLQNWNGTNRNALIAPHGSLFMESYREDGGGSMYGQLGYHVRGSSENVTFENAGGIPTNRSRQRYQFNNISLQVGAKNRLNSYTAKRPYYSFGLRLEYTISTNLSEFEDAQASGYFPLDAFVNKFNYGASVSFGYEFPFSDLIGGIIEVSINPDLSKQYAQPQIPGVIDPVFGGTRTLPEQSVRNISVELSVGFRFLRKVIYIEDY